MFPEAKPRETLRSKVQVVVALGRHEVLFALRRHEVLTNDT